MNTRERVALTVILLLIILMTLLDLLKDWHQGVAVWHVVIEGSMAVIALVGLYFLVKGTFSLKKSLIRQQHISAELKVESAHWRESSKRFLLGLSQSIDSQLDKWNLTKSEKEVAFLLIKGFSLKEIAEYRSTAEKTTRTQATSIYAKSGLSGRTQLSAFFLEDLLLPQED